MSRINLKIQHRDRLQPQPHMGNKYTLRDILMFEVSPIIFTFTISIFPMNIYFIYSYFINKRLKKHTQNPGQGLNANENKGIDQRRVNTNIT